MQNIPYYQVDAFTTAAFSGNAGGVCLLEEAIPDVLMQQIAMENNIAETAFLFKEADGFRLRWFTPTVEIKLCGHGTLAAAHILWQKKMLQPSDTALFYTLAGELTATLDRGWISMSFPRFSLEKTSLPEPVQKAIGVPVQHAFVASDGRFIVEVEDGQQLRSMQPDFDVLKTYPAVAATCRGGGGEAYDFLSRSFVPSHGVNEDPVTGSSHCALAPYWAEKLSKNELFAFQASNRGGELKLTVSDDRIFIKGQAVTVIEGHIVPAAGW